MEVKKSNTANLENQRVQGFLLGLIVVLAAVFVALEWNSSDSGWTFFADDEDLEAEMELSPLKRDQDEIPMMLPQEQKAEQPKSEQLNLVEEDVELPPPVEPELMEKPDPEAEAEEKPEVVDMYNEPIDFREFMKWLTKNLKYPALAQKRKVKGRVVAQFVVNTDGSISDLELTEKLETSCDNEVLRVLRMMPKWQAGMMNAKPCRTKVCIPVVFNL